MKIQPACPICRQPVSKEVYVVVQKGEAFRTDCHCSYGTYVHDTQEKAEKDIVIKWNEAVMMGIQEAHVQLREEYEAKMRVLEMYGAYAFILDNGIFTDEYQFPCQYHGAIYCEDCLPLEAFEDQSLKIKPSVHILGRDQYNQFYKCSECGKFLNNFLSQAGETHGDIHARDAY